MAVLEVATDPVVLAALDLEIARRRAALSALDELVTALDAWLPAIDGKAYMTPEQQRDMVRLRLVRDEALAVLVEQEKRPR